MATGHFLVFFSMEKAAKFPNLSMKIQPTKVILHIEWKYQIQFLNNNLSGAFFRADYLNYFYKNKLTRSGIVIQKYFDDNSDHSDITSQFLQKPDQYLKYSGKV